MAAAPGRQYNTFFVPEPKAKDEGSCTFASPSELLHYTPVARRTMPLVVIGVWEIRAGAIYNESWYSTRRPRCESCTVLNNSRRSSNRVTGKSRLLTRQMCVATTRLPSLVTDERNSGDDSA